MGKSTIASEFCRRHEASLGANFFFSRNDANVGSTEKFFTTLAYQLAQSRAELRPHIARAAESHSKAGASQQMEYAVKNLLDTPLKNAEDAGSVRSPVFIVVDALDECTESSSQPDLITRCLELLVSCVLKHHSFIRLFLTSRPSPNHILSAREGNATLESLSVLLSLYNLEERKAIDCDIEALIKSRLLTTKEGSKWHQSDPTVVGRLTKQSEGVFVYARTAADYIVRSPGAAQMEHRLQLLLTPGNRFGLDNLDLLYRTVLETAFPLDDFDPAAFDQIKLLLAWIALCQDSGGISPTTVEKISGIPCAESIPIISRLRSVLVLDDEESGMSDEESEMSDEESGTSVEESGTSDKDSDIIKPPFRAMHVTFRDFLVDKARCGNHFYVNPGLMHARIAAGIVTRLNMPESEEQDEGEYADNYWKEHIEQAAPVTEEFIGVFKTMFTSLSSTRPSPFCTEYLDDTPSLHTFVDQHVVDRDIIGPAIRSSLCANRYGNQCHAIDSTIVTRLTERAEGRWFYVYTALQFICGGADTAEMENRLQLVLAPKETYDLSNLSLLYRTVLEFPPGDLGSVTREHLRHLLACITLRPEDYPAPTLSELVALSGIPRDEATSTLTQLRPVLWLGSDTGYAHNEQIIHVHPTFKEFLQQRAHSGDDFHVDPDRMHAHLALNCLRLLHNNLYEQPRIEGNPVDYAQRCWDTHAVKSKGSTEDLTNLLKEIFSSVSTSRPSYFFSHFFSSSGPTVVPWVDDHIVSDSIYVVHEFAIKFTHQCLL